CRAARRGRHPFPTRRSSDLYADLKLIAAEAALKTGNAAVAISHINDVRTRTRNWAAQSGYGDGLVPANHPTEETSANTIMQWIRSEEHTSELQSRENLVCRL